MGFSFHSGLHGYPRLTSRPRRACPALFVRFVYQHLGCLLSLMYVQCTAPNSDFQNPRLCGYEKSYFFCKERGFTALLDNTIYIFLIRNILIPLFILFILFHNCHERYRYRRFLVPTFLFQYTHNRANRRKKK